jgi:hypothetical protein
MADPVKEQIAEAMVTTLKTIEPANGFYTDINGRVYRRREHIQEVDKSRLPCVYLFTGDEDQESVSQGGSCYTSNATFVVTGYVRGGEELDDNVIKMEADIKVVGLTDRSQGSTAMDTRYVSTETDWSEFAPIGRGIVVVTFAVLYRWTLTAP